MLSRKIERIAVGVVLAALALFAVTKVLRVRALEADNRSLWNRLASADSTRAVQGSQIVGLIERLAHVAAERVWLGDELGRIAKTQREIGVAYLQLQVRFDSLRATREGTVTVDSARPDVRVLAAALDTGGVHVDVAADVPAPPARAAVRWSVAMDPVSVFASITRTPGGGAILRAHVDSASADRVQLAVDSAVTALEAKAPPGRWLGVPWWIPPAAGALAGWQAKSLFDRLTDRR